MYAEKHQHGISIILRCPFVIFPALCNKFFNRDSLPLSSCVWSNSMNCCWMDFAVMTNLHLNDVLICRCYSFKCLDFFHAPTKVINLIKNGLWLNKKKVHGESNGYFFFVFRIKRAMRGRAKKSRYAENSIFFLPFNLKHTLTQSSLSYLHHVKQPSLKINRKWVSEWRSKKKISFQHAICSEFV